MSTLVFDTLENAKKLKAVGFTKAQAETQTRIIADLVDNQLVTKDYLDRSLTDLRKEIEHKVEMSFYRTVGILGGLLIAIEALPRYFPPR